jgi:DNA-binding response OmpR family regulator
MKILIIESGNTSAGALQELLKGAGFLHIQTAATGEEGMRMIACDLPDLIVLDYALPDTEGCDLCRKLSSETSTVDIPVFIIAGPSEESGATMAAAFEAGACEYFTRPVQAADFLPRLRRTLRWKKLFDQLRQEIEFRSSVEKEHIQQIAQLQHDMDSMKTMKGMLPICSSCRKILNDDGFWQNVERYIREHTEANFTYDICPDCAEKLYPEVFRKILLDNKQQAPALH